MSFKLLEGLYYISDEKSSYKDAKDDSRFHVRNWYYRTVRTFKTKQKAHQYIIKLFQKQIKREESDIKKLERSLEFARKRLEKYQKEYNEQYTTDK